MTYIPGEQHAIGDDLSTAKGPVVLGHDNSTGLAAPVMGSEGTANGNRAPLSSEPGRKGLLGWLYMIWNEIHNSIPGEVQGVGTAITAATTTIQNEINTGVPVFPMGQVGDGGAPFQPAVDENFDPDTSFNRYPLYLKHGTKNVMVSVEAAALPTGAALDSSVAAVTTSLGADQTGVTSPTGAVGVRGWLSAIYNILKNGSIVVTGTFWPGVQAVSGTFWQATQPVSATNLDVALSTRTKPSDQQHAIVDSSALPAGASTEATLALIKAKTDNIDVALSTRTKPADTQTVSGTVTANAGTNLNTSALALDASIGTDGAAPPSIPGTGVRGWLRSCYDNLVLIKNIFPTALALNSGTLTASTLRVVLATDQPTNTNKLAVTATSDQTTHGTTDLAADDVIKWAGTTLSVPVATAPDGSQTAPVMRSLNRKATIIETTTPLAANAVFTGAWHDSNATGDNYVTASSFASHVGAAYVIEESDDTGNANFTRTVATWNGAPAATTLSYMVGVIRARWWRVKYTNGATLQTSWELTTCASSVAPDSIITNNTSNINGLQARQVQVVQPGGAGAGSDNLALFMTWAAQNGAGQGPQDVMIRAHGGKWSGTAAGTKSGASMFRTPTQFKQATATASGDTAVWTPLSGNKFRLLKFKLQLTADAIQASGGRITILLRDATTDIGVGHVVYVPAAGSTALSGGWQSEWIDLGQFGYQSTAANAVLNVNLSAALTGGVCNVIVAGTEE